MNDKSGHLVLFCLKEYLSNEGAGFWSNEIGWVTEEDATRFTEEEARVCRKPTLGDHLSGHVVWMSPPWDAGLKGYLLRATDHNGQTLQEGFFWAVDPSHAREQARDTEPEAKTWTWRMVSVGGIPISRFTQPQRPPLVGRQIFLITKTGPEWQKPIEAWCDEKRAKTRASGLNETLDPNDVDDSLSQYEIVPVFLFGD